VYITNAPLYPSTTLTISFLKILAHLQVFCGFLKILSLSRSNQNTIISRKRLKIDYKDCDGSITVETRPSSSVFNTQLVPAVHLKPNYWRKRCRLAATILIRILNKTLRIVTEISAYILPVLR
jgi:hypothetical protein